MLCDVCREGLEGIWDPENSRRLGLLKDFPEILQFLFDELDGDALDRIFGEGIRILIYLKYHLLIADRQVTNERTRALHLWPPH